MKPEWKDRLAHWMRVLEEEFYEPLGEIALEGFETMEMLSPEAAKAGCFAPMAACIPAVTWKTPRSAPQTVPSARPFLKP